MQLAALESTINAAFADISAINASTQGDIRAAVTQALTLLDTGKARVAEKIPGASGMGSWKVNQWLKKAVLLSFRLNDMSAIAGGPGKASWWDKVPSKFDGWARTGFATPAFAQCQARSSAARPSSPKTSC